MRPALTGSLLLFGLAAAAFAAPAAGGYSGQLCVTTTTAGAPECGPARVTLRSARQAEVRVSDVTYSLTLNSSQVEVVLKHGAMQIDGFTGPYEWKGEAPGNALHFADPAKRVHYEVRFERRLPPPR